MIDPETLIAAYNRGFRPLPGRCLIELDTVPTMEGLLHIPDSAQQMKMLTHATGKTVKGDSSWTGKVLAMTPRRNTKGPWEWNEEFVVGDNVLILLLQEDLNQKVICTMNTRVYAVIGSQIPPDYYRYAAENYPS